MKRTTKQRIKDALEYATDYGGTDGAHHKMWVIDQMVRALTGCPCRTPEAEESDEYKQWVEEHNDGEDGPNTYDWDKGIAP